MKQVIAENADLKTQVFMISDEVNLHKIDGERLLNELADLKVQCKQDKKIKALEKENENFTMNALKFASTTIPSSGLSPPASSKVDRDPTRLSYRYLII